MSRGSGEFTREEAIFWLFLVIAAYFFSPVIAYVIDWLL